MVPRRDTDAGAYRELANFKQEPRQPDARSQKDRDASRNEDNEPLATKIATAPGAALVSNLGPEGRKIAMIKTSQATPMILLGDLL